MGQCRGSGVFSDSVSNSDNCLSNARSCNQQLSTFFFFNTCLLLRRVLYILYIVPCGVCLWCVPVVCACGVCLWCRVLESLLCQQGSLSSTPWYRVLNR